MRRREKDTHLHTEGGGKAAIQVKLPNFRGIGCHLRSRRAGRKARWRRELKGERGRGGLALILPPAIQRTPLPPAFFLTWRGGSVLPPSLFAHKRPVTMLGGGRTKPGEARLGVQPGGSGGGCRPGVAPSWWLQGPAWHYGAGGDERRAGTPKQPGKWAAAPRGGGGRRGEKRSLLDCSLQPWDSWKGASWGIN